MNQNNTHSNTTHSSTVDAVVLESFNRNARVNTAVLDHLSNSDLNISDGQGGMSVAAQLAHMAGFRKDWLNEISPTHADSIDFELGPNNTLVTRDLGELRRAFTESDAAVLSAVQEALSEGRAFQGQYESHPVHFLQHTLIHDAHHRGQLMMLLRQGGHTPEQMSALESATWPIWRE